MIGVEWRAVRVDAALEHARLLSDAEHRQAERYRFRADRDRFVAGRGLMRHALGAVLSLPGDTLELVFGPHGKPALLAHPSLSFNLSHSGQWIVFGWARAVAVGVDVEAVRADVRVLEVAPSVFTSTEVEALRKLDVAEQRSAFFRLWTRKEAVLKAWGTGFSLEARAVHVGLDQGEVRASAPGQPDARVESVLVDDQHFGAVASAGDRLPDAC